MAKILVADDNSNIQRMVGLALKDQGIWPPEGLTYHVASGAGADFKVFEVWESEQHARNFGERLKPVLQKYKIELSREPRPQPVKNTIKGKSL